MQVDRVMAVFMPSKLIHAIDTNLLNVPSPEKIRNSSDLFLYVFVGANAFGLKSFMMKPYPHQNLLWNERIFNCRLSRARRMTGNTFGILATRFRIFRRPIVAKAQTVIHITKCAFTLPNYFIKNRSPNDTYSYCSTNFTEHTTSTAVLDGEWRKEGKGDGFRPFPRVGSNNYS